MLPESMLEQLRGVLAARTGLGFEGRGWHDLEKRVAAAGREAGVRDAEAYVRQLLAAPLEQREIETLARHLTVGETYFFREKHSFEALAHHVLPELLGKREHGARRLRIWSAGCCTGEEAYSIAILLDRLLSGQRDWDISILATDINPAFLEKAEKGIYGDWSFRDTPAWVKNDYFRHARNGMREVLPRIRERVRFSFLNLADDVYPSCTGEMDIIFCRNVLMYFTQDQARAAIKRFHRALREDGLLLVSPAETSSTLFASFSPVNFPGAIFYSPGEPPAAAAKTTGAVPVNGTGSLRKAIQDVAQKPAAVKGSLPPARAAVVAAPAKDAERGPAEKDDAAAFSRNARQAANEGRLDDAADWCAKAIAANKLNPAVYYLAATVDQERGRMADAAQSLQRALYLDPDFALAMFALGNLRLAEGRHADAVRHFENLRALLGGLDRDDILPESGGLTAGRLDEIVASLCAHLFDPATAIAV